MKRSIIQIIVIISLLFPSFILASEIEYRWVKISENLLVDANVKKVQDIMVRAKKAGYNGVLLDDFKFQVLDKQDARYF